MCLFCVAMSIIACSIGWMAYIDGVYAASSVLFLATLILLNQAMLYSIISRLEERDE